MSRTITRAGGLANLIQVLQDCSRPETWKITSTPAGRKKGSGPAPPKDALASGV